MDFQKLTDRDKAEFLRKSFPANAKSHSCRKPLFGFGLNDADYLTQPIISGKQVCCPAYAAWKSMLSRAYCPKCHTARPTYIGITVWPEWLSFMTFRAWWMANQVDGWQLDKDLLSDSREYGQQSCIFVPEWLNSFITDRGAARGDLQIGVSWHKASGKYQAQCNYPFGKNEHLGLFTTADEAHAAWLSRKLEIAAELKPRMDEINVRIYPRVVEIISRAK